MKFSGSSFVVSLDSVAFVGKVIVGIGVVAFVSLDIGLKRFFRKFLTLSR